MKLYRCETVAGGVFFAGNWTTDVKEATRDYEKEKDEEIQQFKVAEMYHKHNRKFGELRLGDLVINDSYLFAINDLITGQIKTNGNVVEEYKFVLDMFGNRYPKENVELHLTAEELQKAHEEATA